MQEILLVTHLIVAVAIIALVLLQPSETGGFMGSSGSMSNMMAPRRTADVLTRATTILAGCFFTTSLLLAVMAGSRPQEASILDMAADQPVVGIEKNIAADAPGTPAKEAKPAEPVEAVTPKAPLAE